MSVSVTLMEEICSLPVDERLQLVEAIWESIAEEASLTKLTEAQETELKRRLSSHSVDPDAVIPWDKVKSDALSRIKG